MLFKKFKRLIVHLQLKYENEIYISHYFVRISKLNIYKFCSKYNDDSKKTIKNSCIPILAD